MKIGDQVRTLNGGERCKVLYVGDIPGDGVPLLVEIKDGTKRNYGHEELEKVPAFDRFEEMLSPTVQPIPQPSKCDR